MKEREQKKRLPEGTKRGAARSPDRFFIPQKNIPLLRRRLLAWHNRHRRDYPWRETDNLFHVMIAEIMLTRTRADQVLPVYNDFTARFRTPEDMIGLNESDCERLFLPLGLRWRGRQICGTAAYLRDSLHLRDITAKTDLKRIPGIGDYCEAMIKSLYFDARTPAVDVNIVRLISRITGTPFLDENRRNPSLIETAGFLIGRSNAKRLNLAMLDLTALVCKPRTPLCGICPLRSLCETGMRWTGSERG